MGAWLNIISRNFLLDWSNMDETTNDSMENMEEKKQVMEEGAEESEETASTTEE